MKILIVDDEQLVRWFMERALIKKGFEVKSASSVQSALDILEKEKFDIVFTDLKMPEGNGAILVDKLREMPHRTVIVVCSAYITAETDQQFRQMGIHTLKKPFKLKELEVLLQKIEPQKPTII